MSVEEIGHNSRPHSVEDVAEGDLGVRPDSPEPRARKAMTRGARCDEDPRGTPALSRNIPKATAALKPSRRFSIGNTSIPGL